MVDATGLPWPGFRGMGASTMRRLTAGLACLGLLWALAGCTAPVRGGGGRAGDAAASATTAADGARAAAVKRRGGPPGDRQLNLAVYYLRSFRGRRYLAPEWHPVPSTRAVAAAALGELLAGQPLCPGSRRPFPAGTRLRGVSVQAGTATVALSGTRPPGRWPLQALVHTLTQFPTVKRVLVRVGSRPVAGPLTRDPDLPLAPIALAEPAAGALVKGDRLVVRGEASVYEGTVGLRLRDDRGQVMAQGHATAARGAPGRGPFSGALSFTPPATSHAWTLEAFEVSPEDGAVVYAVRLPVWVGR
jgi:Immunoglobulin-like domain of bacterial spore germination/Sporulation and spore germination